MCRAEKVLRRAKRECKRLQKRSDALQREQVKRLATIDAVIARKEKEKSRKWRRTFNASFWENWESCGETVYRVEKIA